MGVVPRSSRVVVRISVPRAASVYACVSLATVRVCPSTSVKERSTTTGASFFLVIAMETVAAAQILREQLPGLKVRVVNVVDLMTLIRPKDHPHGMTSTLFTELFTDTVDVVFAFHGYPGAIHQLVHGRPDADRFRVRGFIEQGTTTTPFDMTVRNKASRYHLVIDAINNARRLPVGATDLKEWCEAQLRRHEKYVVEHLEDMPEVRDWSLGDWAHHG